MRILYIVHQFMPEFSTGTEVFTMNIAKSQQRNGHHVDVLTCATGPASVWRGEAEGLWRAVVNGIPIYAIPRAELGNFSEIAGTCTEKGKFILSHFIGRGKYDVVHVAHSMRMHAAIDFVRMHAIPYVVTLTDYYTICHRVILRRSNGLVCGGPENGRNCQTFCSDSVMTEEIITNRRRWFYLFLKNAQNVVACSEYIARIFELEYPNIKVSVQHHGLSLRKFMPRIRKQTNQGLIFGFVGTISEQKGVLILAEAFKKARPNNAFLELVGPTYGNDTTLKRLASLSERGIKVAGPVPHSEVPKTLQRFDLLCVPSIWPEPGTFALREGFAAGLPAIVSDLGWPGEVVGTLGCGMAIPAGNTDAWCEAIKYICDNPSILSAWRNAIPSQYLIEEEAFFYNQAYIRCCMQQN